MPGVDAEAQHTHRALDCPAALPSNDCALLLLLTGAVTGVSGRGGCTEAASSNTGASTAGSCACLAGRTGLTNLT
jgi:hypothetical protein